MRGLAIALFGGFLISGFPASLTAQTENAPQHSLTSDGRKEYRSCIFWEDNIPKADSIQNAIFRDCLFLCRADTLFLADHADQMVLIDCEILGGCVVRWSRNSVPGDRNYQYGLKYNGRELVIEEDGTVTVELEGLPLYDALVSTGTDDATVLHIGVVTGDSGIFMLKAAADGPVPDGFFGWQSSDERVKLSPCGDGSICSLSVPGGVTEDFDFYVSVFCLNGLESCSGLFFYDGAIHETGRPRVSVTTEPKYSRWSFLSVIRRYLK